MAFDAARYGILGHVESLFQLCATLTIWIGTWVTMGVLSDKFDFTEKYRLVSFIFVCILGFFHLLALVFKILKEKEVLAIVFGLVNLLTSMWWALAIAHTGFSSVVPILACGLFLMAQFAKFLNLHSGSWEPVEPFTPTSMKVITVLMAIFYLIIWIMEILTSTYFSSVSGWIG